MVSQQIECEESGRIVTVTSSSARSIKLTPSFKGGEMCKNGVLNGVDYNGEFCISVGEVLPIKRQRFMINGIKRLVNTKGQHIGYTLIVAKLNKSSMFLFPFLNYSRPYYRWKTDFMNCFNSTEDNPNEVALYLWYKYSASIEMEEFEEKIKKHPQYVETIDVDQYHVLYKFSIPTRYYEDYKLIIQGKYSRISEIAKERILDFHSAKNNSPLYKILNRDPSRREKMEKELDISISESDELHDPFYEEEERYLNKYNIPALKISKW